MRILAIDYGEKRIGLASCDPMQIIATPIGTYNSVTMRSDIDYIAKVVGEIGAESIVMGLPLNMDGTDGIRVNKTRAFGRNIEKVTGIKVVYQDERLSTVTAENLLIENNVSREKRKKIIDTVSAQIILESYLNNNKL